MIYRCNMVYYLGGKDTEAMIRVEMKSHEKDSTQNEGLGGNPQAWGGGSKRGGLTTKAPDLAVPCSRGWGSALASGHLCSWKWKWGMSDSNIFSEPVKNITKMEKLSA